MNDMMSLDQQTSRFFEQHPLPSGIPGSYEFTRRMRIVARGLPGHGGPDAPLDELGLALLFLDETDKGTPHGPDADWQSLVAEMIARELHEVGNPLDFQLHGVSRIAIQLVQPFWHFSTSMDPLTTKEDCQGKYYDLRLHMVGPDGLVSETPEQWRQGRGDTPCSCISFQTKEPVEGTSDGFSLNIDLVSVQGDRLLKVPITIDPDIENKGSNQPLEDPTTRSVEVTA